MLCCKQNAMKRDFVAKPYNRCLYCQKRQSDPAECNGPRTASMETPRWREYMRDLKEVSGLTFEELSERTSGKMSAPSIQMVLAPSAKGDVTRETARIIENAIFGNVVAPPCPFDLLNEIPADTKKVMETEAELQKLRENISLICGSHDKELAAVRTEADKKVNFLLAEIERLRKEIDRKDAMIDKLLK